MAIAKEKLIIAKMSHALSSPRKTNLVLKALVGRPAVLALKQLTVIPKRAGEPVTKLIKQAIGNAVFQHQASPDHLVIDSAFATKGRTLKRAHIGGRGRTKPYERITSHLTLYLRIVSPKSVKLTPITPNRHPERAKRVEGSPSIQESHPTKTASKKTVKTKKTK